MNVVNALLCCQVCATQFYRDLVFAEVSEQARCKTALRFEAWRALGAPWGDNSRPFVHEPDIDRLLPEDSPLWKKSFEEIQAAGHDGLTHDTYLNEVSSPRNGARKKATSFPPSRPVSSPTMPTASPTSSIVSASTSRPAASTTPASTQASFLQINSLRQQQGIKKGGSGGKAPKTGKSGKGGKSAPGTALSDANTLAPPPVIDPPTRHALLAPCCKLCRGDFEGMKPPSGWDIGNPFPPPARRAETSAGEGYTNLLETASSSTARRAGASSKAEVGTAASAHTNMLLGKRRNQGQEQRKQQQHNKLFLRQPKEQFNKVISSAPIASKMQKIKKTKTLVDLAKIKAQLPVALNFPHCCPVCSASRFPTLDYEDVRDVPTVLPGTFLQLEFKSRMQGFVGAVAGAAGAAAAGPLGGMIGGLMGNPVCPKGGGCVMCPNSRTDLPPFGEPFTVRNDLQESTSIFSRRQSPGYHLGAMSASLGRRPGGEKVETSDKSGINCQKNVERNLRNNRPCKAVLGPVESRDSNLNLGDSGPGER